MYFKRIYWLLIFVINILIISTWKWHWRPCPCEVEEMAWNFGTPWTKSSCFHRTYRFFGPIRYASPVPHLMTWEAHINHISTTANKKIGLIWKVSLQFPRTCAETIYTNYVRPVLDYGCAVYDNCSRHLTNKLEGVQRNAAVACTRAFRRTPTSSLLTELGWCSLEVRRKYFRLITLYKMIHNRTPGYLRSLLPPRQGQYARSRKYVQMTVQIVKHDLYLSG